MVHINDRDVENIRLVHINVRGVFAILTSSSYMMEMYVKDIMQIKD